MSESGYVSPSVSGTVEEGDVAADYIEELLDICDLDGDLEIETRDGRSYITVTAEEDSNLKKLSRPDVVTALQELTRVAVQTKLKGSTRLILDIAGSRDLREQELSDIVDRSIEKLELGSVKVSLPPMSSYERKLVHDMVAAKGYTSESEGEGAGRHTTIRATSAE